MPRQLTTTEKQSRAAHFAEHDRCWLCAFIGRKQVSKTDLHHIAGRGRRHEVRENFAALCSRCHEAIQSRKDAEVICLVLKKRFDTAFYSPETICRLRGKADSWITDGDVIRAGRIVEMMCEVLR